MIVFGVSMVSRYVDHCSTTETLIFQLYKKRKIMQGRGKSGKQALNLTEEMVRDMREMVWIFLLLKLSRSTR